MKRTEFPLKTDYFLGLKSYIKFPTVKNSNRTNQLNGYPPEFTALHATRPEHTNQCNSTLKQRHNEEYNPMDHTFEALGFTSQL